MHTYVIYDIVDDRIRKKIADVCLDYGLKRIQYSAFLGDINTTRRRAMFGDKLTIFENRQVKPSNTDEH